MVTLQSRNFPTKVFLANNPICSTWISLRTTKEIPPPWNLLTFCFFFPCPSIAWIIPPPYRSCNYKCAPMKPSLGSFCSSTTPHPTYSFWRLDSFDETCTLSPLTPPLFLPTVALTTITWTPSPFFEVTIKEYLEGPFALQLDFVYRTRLVWGTDLLRLLIATPLSKVFTGINWSGLGPLIALETVTSQDPIGEKNILF